MSSLAIHSATWSAAHPLHMPWNEFRHNPDYHNPAKPSNKWKPSEDYGPWLDGEVELAKLHWIYVRECIKTDILMKVINTPHANDMHML